jgi:hypothetical protein
LFAGVLTSTLENSSAVAAGLTVATFGLGMGMLLAVLTMAVALGRTGLVRSMRKVLPWIHRISGGLLVVAGLFVAYYGWTEHRISRGDRVEGGLSVTAQNWQGDVQTWVVEHQATLGWVCGALVVAAIGWVALGRLRRTDHPALPDPPQPTGVGSRSATPGTPRVPNSAADGADALHQAAARPVAQGASRSMSQDPPASR